MRLLRAKCRAWQLQNTYPPWELQANPLLGTGTFEVHDVPFIKVGYISSFPGG